MSPPCKQQPPTEMRGLLPCVLCRDRERHCNHLQGRNSRQVPVAPLRCDSGDGAPLRRPGYISPPPSTEIPNRPGGRSVFAGFAKALASPKNLAMQDHVTYSDSVDLEDKVDEAATAIIPSLEFIFENLDKLEKMQRSRQRALSRRVKADGGKAESEVPPPPTAACQDSGLDYITDHNGFAIGPKHKRVNFEDHLAYCNVCRMKDDCLDRATWDRTKIGIWGGLMPSERMRAWRTTARSVAKK